jgi:hypothetical protein
MSEVTTPVGEVADELILGDMVIMTVVAVLVVVKRSEVVGLTNDVEDVRLEVAAEDEDE